jgi:hypothetical protein
MLRAAALAAALALCAALEASPAPGGVADGGRGADVVFFGDGQNGKLITNFKKLVVPGIAPAPAPYNGQFVQVDVVDVKE